jgi:peroxiredoxin
MRMGIIGLDYNLKMGVGYMGETLMAGNPVEDFVLKGVDGATFDSRNVRSTGLLMFVFWKAGCGTCQYSMPFLQRFHDLYAGDGFRIWGISQEDRAETLAFMKEFSLSFPQTLDEDLAITEAYRLVSVPGVYLVGPSNKVLRHASAFAADEFNVMAALIAKETGKPYIPVVRPEDDAPAIRPG